jgi:hypothetical protein
LEVYKEVGRNMEIKILGKTYKVKYIKGLADYGSTEFESQTILIKDGMTEENKQSVLLHEIIEILNEDFNLSLPHQTIQTLEAGLFAIYKDNF